jgi:hypothetical protein
MATAGYVVAWVLLVLAALVALVNWVCFLRNYRNRRRGVDQHASIIPALGFILLVIAGFICPHGPGAWIVVPVMVDPGTWVVIALPFVMLREWLSPKKPGG